MVYGIYNELVTGAFVNQHSHHVGASHCMNHQQTKSRGLVNKPTPITMVCGIYNYSHWGL